MSAGSVDGASDVVGVVGLGTMGCGIAAAAIFNGIDVVATDHDQAATSGGALQVASRVERLIELRDRNDSLPLGRLHVLDDLAGLADDRIAMIVEAVPESYDIKAPILRDVSAASTAVIATNTSALSIDRLANSVVDPARFLGVHFFNPAEWIPGVEVIRGALTDDEAVTGAVDLLVRMSKYPAVVADSAGFVANRIQFAMFAECARCLEEGIATAEEIDRIVRTTFGFRLGAYGPFQVADMAGLDVYLSILETMTESIGDHFAPTAALRESVNDGRLGTKCGGGFFDYGDDVELVAQERDAAYGRLLRTLGLLSSESTY